jgi:hypothetical protein
MLTERHFPDALAMYRAVIEWAAAAPPSVSMLNADNPPDIGICAYWSTKDQPGWPGGENVEHSFMGYAPAHTMHSLAIGEPNDALNRALGKALRTQDGRLTVLKSASEAVRSRRISLANAEPEPRSAWDRLLVNADEDDAGGVVLDVGPAGHATSS